MATAGTPQAGGRSALIWVLAGFQGRIARGIYWLGYLFLVCIQAAVLSQMVGEQLMTPASGGNLSAFGRAVLTAGPLVLLATLYVEAALSVKRLHDIGYSGLMALVIVVPFVNAAFAIWIGILPGEPGPNRFGERPDVPPLPSPSA